MEQKFNKDIPNSIKERRLFIGQHMVSDTNFDIKKYLMDVQKQFELESSKNANIKVLPPITINKYDFSTDACSKNLNTISNLKLDTSNSKKKHKIMKKSNSNFKNPFITLNNLISLSKNSSSLNSFDSDSVIKNVINTDFNDLNMQTHFLEPNSLESTKTKIRKNLKKSLKNANSSKIIFRKKIDDIITIDEPRFNVIKAIKEIKKRENSLRIHSLKKLNEKCKSKENYNDIYIKLDNDIESNKYNYKGKKMNKKVNSFIVFDKKNEDAVFEPFKVLHNYEMHKQLQVEPSEKYVNKFITQNKEVSKDNILIKLMNSEIKKLKINHNLRTEGLFNAKKTIETNESNFDEYRLAQNKVCIQIDELLMKFNKKYRLIINKEYNCKLEIKIILDEIRKILHKIDHLRIYGKFVNQVLGGDISIFEQEIFQEQKYDDEIDYEELSNNVINLYKILLQDSNNGKIITGKTLFNEPEIMLFKFKEMEDMTLRNLSIIHDTNNEYNKMKEENDYDIKYLKEKKERLEKELEEVKENYEHENLIFDEIKKRYIYQKGEFNRLIKNFYIYVNNNLIQKNIIINPKEIYKKLVIQDCIQIIHNTIYDLETYVDNLILTLRNWEKSDPKVFGHIIELRKKYFKEMKQLNILNQRMKERMKIKNNYDYNKKKVVLYSRKTEPPYYKKKKVIKIEDTKKYIKLKENEDYIDFEDEYE